MLFTLVTTELSIEEREYFSLCFYDENGIRHWLYNDKKILKQLKGQVLYGVVQNVFRSSLGVFI